MAHLIGLDLGSYSVKLTIFEGSFGRYQLQSALNQRVPSGPQPLVARQSEALSRLLSALHIQNPAISAALSAEHATSRFIQLPFGDPSKVEQVLPFQIAGMVPFDIDDMFLSQRIVQLNEDQCQTMACLVSKEQIRSTLEDFVSLGVDPNTLSVDADILSHFATEGNEAIIDIGHSRTLCTLCVEGKGAAFRQVKIGMSRLVEALATSQEIDEEEAESLLWMTDLSLQSAGIENLDFSPLYQERDALIQAIQTTLILFEDSTEIEINRIRLCGGGAQQRGMVEILEQALGVPVEAIQPPLQLQSLESPEAHALSFALGSIATGTTSIRPIDLRQAEFAFKGHLANLGRIVRIGSIAAVASLVLGLGWFGFRYVDLSSQINDRNEKIVSEIQEAMPEISAELLTDADMAYSILQSDVVDSSEKMSKLGSIVAEEPPVLGLLKAISEYLPKHSDARVDVSDLNITDNAIIMKATTDGFEDAAEMEASLQKFPKFKGAKKSNEEKGRRNQGIEFTITIPLEQEVEEEEI